MRQTHRPFSKHVSTPATGTCVWLIRVPPVTTTRRELVGTLKVLRAPRVRQVQRDHQDRRELLQVGRPSFGLAHPDILQMEALPLVTSMSSTQGRRPPPSQ